LQKNGEVLMTRQAAKPARRTQEERADLTRTSLFEATIRLLKSEGYSGLRMTAIAGEAGVSVGALTHHFPKKEQIVLGAFEYLFSRAMDEAASHAARVRRDSDVVHLVVRDSINWFLSEDFGVVLDLLAIGGRDVNFRRELVRIARAKRKSLQDIWLGAMRDAGYPADKARDILWLSISVARGLVASQKLWDDKDRMPRLLGVWEQMVTDHLAAGQAGGLAI
jgi:AcrR family transcriptional regulator